MNVNRYLIYMSYMGKPFKGSQRQVKASIPRLPDPTTIQGRIEMGLKELNPAKDPIVFLSSRTDSGVHAFSATCHVDLYRNLTNFMYQPKTVTICLNKYFAKEEVPIRILKTYSVPLDFHCRHQAISRLYLYRFCVIKSETQGTAPDFCAHLPIEEMERVSFSTNSFDIDEMRSAAKLFEGLHDFRTFMGRGSFDKDKMTQRVITRIDINEAKPALYSPSSLQDKHVEDYKFYDLYIEGTGFLYRQVRRTLGALIGVAQGKITRKEIRSMLEVPSHNSWNSRLRSLPAFSLYLCEVKYPDTVYETIFKSELCNQ